MEIKETINSIKSGYGCVEIYPSSHQLTNVFIYCDGNRLSENVFTWKTKADVKKAVNECGTPFYLTLEDISSQWYGKRRDGVLTVLVETATQGTFYRCGRHNKTVWEKHGVTEGYA